MQPHIYTSVLSSAITAAMDVIIKLTILITLMFHHASSFSDTDLNGIIFTAITVDDIDQEEKFYIDILGGMKVDKLSTDGLYGDSVFYSMYQSEYEKYKAALDAGDSVDFEYYGICDIRDSGSQKIAWSMVMIDTSVLILMQCRDRDNDTPITFERPNRGSAKIGVGAHIAFWARDEIVPLQQIADIIDTEQSLNMPNVGFITGFPVESEEERSQLPDINFLLPAGAGIAFSATRGAQTEKVEISYRNGDGLSEDLNLYCKYEGVSTLMLRPPEVSMYKDNLSRRMAGLHHTSITGKNNNDTKTFYTEVLGGKFYYELTIPAGTPGWYDIVFQDDYLEAQSSGIQDTNEDYAKYGIVKNFETSGTGATFTFGMILFDNTFLEYYAFNDEASLISETETEDRYLGPGYSRNFVNGYMVKEDKDINKFIQDMEDDAAQKGMPQVKANRAVDETDVQLTDYTEPLTQNDLAGMNFVFFKGPSGETGAIVQFKDKAKDALKEAMLEYGALSTAFDETNPNTFGGFKQYCNSINPPSFECNCDGCCNNVASLRPIFNIFLMIAAIAFVKLF